MALSDEEKKRCTVLWEWATELKSDPNDWNEETASLLAEMYAEIINCSKAMNWAPRPAGVPSWSWLLKQLYLPLIRSITNKHKVYEACRVVAVRNYKDYIIAHLGN
ncbi:MAG: hypothetical protein JW795_10760 [Chitinivibrionales bacterium]|nr:hypothetical protein [Chitinivibrionales bacterium]